MKQILFVMTLVMLFSLKSDAQIIHAHPGNYITLLSTLTPGDTLLLAEGDYTDRLSINNMNGTSSDPMVIMGSGNLTVFKGDACCNTVSIRTSSFITLTDFTIDGQNLAIDGVKAEGTEGNWAHHIVLDNLNIIGHGVNQQTVGISTKCPAWDWTITGCTIDAAGTGIYLGNSDGEEPFVNGIIEYNLIKNTLGYNLQIKHQNVGSRNVAGMTLNGKTLIRHNVFSKESNANQGGDSRPNLLVGNFPASGDGSNDHYEIYGNFFWQNPSESLFQGTGNIAFYDNICVNHSGGFGVSFQPHNSFEPRNISIFHNTVICDQSWGIRLLDTDIAYQKYVYGNAVFSDHSTPIRIVGGGMSTTNLLENIADVVSNANTYVHNATNDIVTLDLYPVAGSGLNSTIIPNTPFLTYSDHSKDFNANNRNWTYRGAYSGEGMNPGWHPAIDKKPMMDTTSTNTKDITKANIPEFQLYPNPTHGSIWLNFNSPVSKIEVTLVTLNGEVLYQQSFAGGKDINLRTSELPAGVYFVRIRTNEFLTTRKLIKI